MTVRSSGFVAVAALVAALGAANAADAPSPSAPSATSDWSFAVHSYTWATSLDGYSRTLPPGGEVKIHLGFSDILKHLDGALMLSGDARRDRLVLFGDLLVSKLSAGKAFTARGYASSVSLESSSVVGLATAGWRVVDEPTLTVDVLGGVRGFALSNTIALTVGPAGGSHAVDRQWVDAVGGVRAAWSFADRWSLTGMGFAGGGGAKYEWDLFGGIGHRFEGRYSAFVGYRAFRVDYRQGSYVWDTLQYGPIVGMRMSF